MKTVIEPMVAADRWLTEDGVKDIADRLNAASEKADGVRPERRLSQPRPGIRGLVRRADRLRALPGPRRPLRRDRAGPVLGAGRPAGRRGPREEARRPPRRDPRQGRRRPGLEPLRARCPQVRLLEPGPASRRRRRRAHHRGAPGRERPPVRRHRVRQRSRRRLRGHRGQLHASSSRRASQHERPHRSRRRRLHRRRRHLRHLSGAPRTPSRMSRCWPSATSTSSVPARRPRSTTSPPGATHRSCWTTRRSRSS